MKTASFILSIFNFRNLGYCSLCMRISFAAMILSWLLALGLLMLNVSTMAVVVGAMSLALTTLWLAHVIKRAIRSIPKESVEINAKRGALRTFGRAMLGAAVVDAGL